MPLSPPAFASPPVAILALPAPVAFAPAPNAIFALGVAVVLPEALADVPIAMLLPAYC
jgi:hypothetical protein